MAPRTPHRSSFRIIFPSNRVRLETGVGTSAGRARCAGPARNHEKPIASFLPRSRQRLPSNRSIRPAPRDLLPLIAPDRAEQLR